MHKRERRLLLDPLELAVQVARPHRMRIHSPRLQGLAQTAAPDTLQVRAEGGYHATKGGARLQRELVGLVKHRRCWLELI